MLKKTITYTDYNGVERKEDFYFNLSKADLIFMDGSQVGGMRQRLEKIIQSQDTVAITEVFRDLIRRSYGERSEDGRRFIKKDELSDAFEQTEAYSELVVELLSDPNKAAEFVNGILPKDLMDQVDKLKATEAG